MNPFDIACGTDKIRKAIEAGASVGKIQDSWAWETEKFADERKPYLLY